MFTVVEQLTVPWKDSALLTYQLALGDFDTDDSSTESTALFILSSAFLTILMLNLLISVMGDSFDRVQSNKVRGDIMKKLELIIEFELLQSWWNWTKGKDTLLTVCQETREEGAEEEVWEGRVAQIGRKLDKNRKQIENQVQELRDQLGNQMDQLVKKIEEISNRLPKDN